MSVKLSICECAAGKFSWVPIRDDDLEDSRWECRINQLTIATLSRDSDTIFSIFTIRIMGFKELFRWDASVSFDKFLIWNFTNESVSFDSLPGPLWCWEKQTHFRGFQSTKWHQLGQTFSKSWRNKLESRNSNFSWPEGLIPYLKIKLPKKKG